MMAKINSATKAAVKKVLDKSGERCYNIINDGAGALGSLNTDIATVTTGGRNSDDIRKKILLVCEAVKKFTADFKYSSVPLRPVLAGGSIRDIFLGTRNRDIDIFLDLGYIPDPEERQDTYDIFVEDLAKHLAAIRERMENSDYGGAAFMPGSLAVSNLRSFMPNDGNPLYRCDIQIIGVSDGYKKPIDIITDFDYNLVKGGIDIMADELILSEEAWKGYTNKEIIVDLPSGFKRSFDWLARSDLGWPIKNPKEIPEPKPKKAKKAVKGLSTATWDVEAFNPGGPARINRINDLLFLEAARRIERPVLNEIRFNAVPPDENF